MKSSLFLVAIALLVAPNVIADDHVVSGTITAVDSAAKTVTIKTADGVETTAKFTEKTTVEGGKDLAGAATAAAKMTALGAKKGSQAVIHYTGEGAMATADGVKVVGAQSVKVAKGTVTAVDRGSETMAVKTADGAEVTYHFASDGVVEGAKATAAGTAMAGKETAHGVTAGSEVTVHYTEEGGKKVVHGIAHIF